MQHEDDLPVATTPRDAEENLRETQRFCRTIEKFGGVSHLPRPARCCLTVCRKLSSPPAGCSYSGPLPSQCRASANRRGSCGQKTIHRTRPQMQQKQIKGNLWCGGSLVLGPKRQLPFENLIERRRKKPRLCCQDEDWKFTVRMQNAACFRGWQEGQSQDHVALWRFFLRTSISQ